ncbi:MAG: type II secretion system F family protein [Methanobacteriota archaeon]
MQSKKARRWSLKKFFSAVGGGVFKLGESVQKLPAPTKKSETTDEKPYDASDRFQDIERPATPREEEFTEEELELAEEDIRIKRPPPERLSKVFFKLFKWPAQRLAGHFKGMDRDLYSANMKITPERYAARMIGFSVIVTALTLLLTLFLRIPLILTALGSALIFIFSMFFTRTQPKRRSRARAVEVNKLLPYALRHMGTQLSSGIGLPETITSVSRAKYGALSEEFTKVVRDMHAGMGFEEALSAMENRVDSEPLRRATRQIQRTLRTGGDLARTLNVMAEETAFELRMKLRDYTQSLNMFTMIYMFASAVIPAMLMVVINISAGRGQGALSPQAAGVIYLVLLPFMLIYFVMMIKRFEPRL